MRFPGRSSYAVRPYRDASPLAARPGGIHGSPVRSVLKRSFLGVLAFGSLGALGLCLSAGPSLCSFERVGTDLQSELHSASAHAIPTAELRRPLELGELRALGAAELGGFEAVVRAALRSAAGAGNQTHADKRHMIRLLCRGASVPHSSDDPPEPPRSLS